MIGVVAVVMAVFWAAIVIAGYLLAGHRAKSAADLAALSGASALVGGRDGCPVAVQIAARQGAAARCRRVGDQIDFVITVTATVRVSAAVPGLPSQVSAVGHAGPVTTGDAGEEVGR
jgi:secretion/DNA translocation related TadE-like protein